MHSNFIGCAPGNPGFFFHDLVQDSELSMPPLPKKERVCVVWAAYLFGVGMRWDRRGWV